MKKHKNKNAFKQKTLRLKDNHTWRAPEGFKIVVLDRGTVRFNIPESWHVATVDPFELNDKPPPDDNARLSVSFWRLPKGVDWTGLPLSKMLTDAIQGHTVDVLERGKLLTSPRTDLEIIWTEHRFLDPVEPREAFSRFALARGSDTQVFISSDFWVDDTERMIPIWDEVLRSLQLGLQIDDPTKGVTLH